MHRPGMVSIWFFIGVLLLIYGALILGAGFPFFMGGLTKRLDQAGYSYEPASTPA